MPVRMLAVHCPDWPTVAAGVSPGTPAAVVGAGQVIAASPAARAVGVHPGLRRREAQSRCPELVLLPDDPERDARAFEPLVVAVESVIPGVEVPGPGECVVPVRGAARYFGGDEAAVERVRGVLATAWPVSTVAVGAGPAFGIGVADGPFAAAVAARRGVIVPVGGTAAFLAPLPVELLADGELVDLLRRLGLDTLGRFAALPPGEVLARFGPAGGWAHRLARGADPRSGVPREQPLDLSVTVELDPPADRVEYAAFAARRLAEQAHDRLGEYGLACTRMLIEAETAVGERHSRVWRHDGPLSVPAITDRIRWQLDGWLTGSARPRGEDAAGRPAGGATGTVGNLHVGPSAGVVRLRLVPDGLVAADGRQLGLWGEPGAAAARVARALSRVQGMLGPDAVLTAVVGGGRDPAARVRLVPWGEPRTASGLEQPWPGVLPSPAPTVTHAAPMPVVVLDAVGEPVGVSGRCAVTAPPAHLVISPGSPVPVTGWAGPWPVDERWWDRGARRRARFQVTVEAGAAYLLAVSGGRWWLEASYD